MAPSPDSDAVLRALAGAISDLVVVLDADGRYLDVISRRHDLLVRPAGEILGRTVHDVFPAAIAERFVGWIRRALQMGMTVEDEYEIDVGGRPTWFAASVAPLTESSVIWVARDITERKTLEAQLRQAAKMDAVGRLAGGVAHDFNNLLTAISTNADLALAALDGESDVREEITQIRRAADRAAALTRQLLAFSRKQMLQPRVLSMNDAVRDATAMLERLIGEHIELVISLDDDTWPVLADAGQLTQVIVNLAVNARDAMPDGGVLTITTGNIEVTSSLATRRRGLVAGEYAVLTVRDTGTGMDHRTQERAFEPFFTTKEQGKGTGLGLATVYGIIKQSNGYIHLTSTPGRGTAFWIFLPRARATVQEPVSRSSSPAETPSAATVLIVEDEAQVRGAAARVLRRAGYTVLECPNGADALDVWRRHEREIALVVTDVVMPQLGGRELVRHLREQGSMVPVLFISGYAEGSTPDRADDARRSAFLAKPFDIGVLVRKVGELIADASRAATPPSPR